MSSDGQTSETFLIANTGDKCNSTPTDPLEGVVEGGPPVTGCQEQVSIHEANFSTAAAWL